MAIIVYRRYRSYTLTLLDWQNCYLPEHATLSLLQKPSRCPARSLSVTMYIEST